MTSFDLDLSRYQLGWADDEEFVFRPEKGLNAEVVDQMSWWKGEPEWMRQFRLRSLRTFQRKPMLPWFAVNMQHAVAVLEELGIEHRVSVVSAHRTPQLLAQEASGAEAEGIEVLIAGAGGAAHLPGMNTRLV